MAITFEITGKVIAPQQQAVFGADVVLVKEVRYDDEWEILDRGLTDKTGSFTLNCPLNATAGKRELKILVLPTELTGAALHNYRGPIGSTADPRGMTIVTRWHAQEITAFN